MAIHVLDPNKIGTQTEEMFNVTNTTGRDLINKFASNIDSLKSHWKGSDAVANITDLANVYSAVTKLVTTVQKYIVSANNEDVLRLQKSLVASGGNCAIGNELSNTLSNVATSVSVPTDGGESWTDAAISSDASTFENLIADFDKFVTSIDQTKEALLANWLEGANRDAIDIAFKEFDKNVPTYREQIKKVSNNLNTVAKNKRDLLQ